MRAEGRVLAGRSVSSGDSRSSPRIASTRVGHRPQRTPRATRRASRRSRRSAAWEGGRRETSSAEGIRSTATTSSASRVPTWSPRKPSSGGPARNARVPDRRDHADPGGGAPRVVGGGAHADREAERGAEPPEHDADARPAAGCRRRRSAARPTRGRRRGDHSTGDPAEPVEQRPARPAGRSSSRPRTAAKPATPDPVRAS